MILHANVTVSGRIEGSVATYTCHDGYLPSGSLETICRGGFWTYTGTPPFCQGITSISQQSIHQIQLAIRQCKRLLVSGVIVCRLCLFQSLDYQIYFLPRFFILSWPTQSHRASIECRICCNFCARSCLFYINAHLSLMLACCVFYYAFSEEPTSGVKHC